VGCAPGSPRLRLRLPARRPTSSAGALALARLQRLRRLNKRLQREQMQRRSTSPGSGGLYQHLLLGQQHNGDTASSASPPAVGARSDSPSEQSCDGGYYQPG
jgi:hypothetical protein